MKRIKRAWAWLLDWELYQPKDLEELAESYMTGRNHWRPW